MYLEKNMELEFGEEICNCCDGDGVTEFRRGNGIFIQNFCDKCLGSGKVTWIEQLLGKKDFKIPGSFPSQTRIFSEPKKYNTGDIVVDEQGNCFILQEVELKVKKPEDF